MENKKHAGLKGSPEDFFEVVYYKLGTGAYCELVLIKKYLEIYDVLKVTSAKNDNISKCIIRGTG